MSASKRPSTSSLRRFITSRPYVTVAELRRRFALEEADGMCCVRRDGVVAWIGLPERETTKLQDLWDRGEVGVELSVEVHAPVVVGVYPMRIARYVLEGNGAHHPTNGHAPAESADHAGGNGVNRPPHPRAPRPMSGAPGYGRPQRRA